MTRRRQIVLTQAEVEAALKAATERVRTAAGDADDPRDRAAQRRAVALLTEIGAAYGFALESLRAFPALSRHVIRSCDAGREIFRRTQRS